MRSPFERIPEDVIRQAVVDGWGLGVDELRYLPEGGGSYHWVAHRHGAARWFVTIDDLDTKPWLGDEAGTVFAGLLGAYAAAAALHAGGAGFVVAPIPSRTGDPAHRIDDLHALSVFPLVDGVAGQWGRPFAPATLGEVVAMLADLHRRAVSTPGVARRGLDLPGRPELLAALDDLGRAWDGGPLSEAARLLLAVHADRVGAWLGELERTAAALDGPGAPVVITHGEPHPGNLIRTPHGLALVDWDTVAAARPERDLWMVAEADPGLVATYEAATGRTVDPDALSAYRLLWALADVASFVDLLRGPHERKVDTERALTALQRVFAGVEPAPYG